MNNPIKPHTSLVLQQLDDVLSSRFNGTPNTIRLDPPKDDRLAQFVVAEVKALNAKAGEWNIKSVGLLVKTMTYYQEFFLVAYSKLNELQVAVVLAEFMTWMREHDRSYNAGLREAWITINAPGVSEWEVAERLKVLCKQANMDYDDTLDSLEWIPAIMAELEKDLQPVSTPKPDDIQPTPALAEPQKSADIAATKQ